MTLDEIAANVTGSLGEGAVTVKSDGEPCLVVEPAMALAVMRELRDRPGLEFGYLRCLSGQDLPPDRMAVVYHLSSISSRGKLTVRIEVSRERPAVPSVVGIWPTADWYEREAYDLLGIDFPGHPDLRRIMLPDDWEGHPLRKDWKDPPEIYGIPTTRKAALDAVRPPEGLPKVEPKKEAGAGAAAPDEKPPAAQEQE